MVLLVINQRARVTHTEVFSVAGTPNTTQKHCLGTALQAQENFLLQEQSDTVALPSTL